MSDLSDRDAFHMAETLPDFLKQEPRSERLLLDLLRGNINRRIDLKTISEADYGIGASKIYLELEKICETGDVGSQPFDVREVFALTRWSRPDMPDWDSGNAGIRSHMQRAFACAALLRCTNHNEGDSINCILAPLLESCIELGPDYLEALKQFVVSEITKLCTPQLRRESSSEKFYEDDDKVIAYSFYSVAYCIILHIFYLNNKKSRNIDVLKNSLIFSIQCGNYTSIMQHQAVENWWLYGASFQDMSYDIWHKLAQTHLFDQIEKFPPSLHDTIRFLGDKLVTAS